VRRRQSHWACMLLATLLAAPRARADEVEARATALFHQGFASTQRGDYKEAERLFDESFRLSPRGSTLLNIAVCEIQEGKPLEALKDLKAALGFADFASHRALAQDDMDRLYAEKVARIAVDTDEGAHVSVDGETVAGVAPFAEAIDVLPGSHDLTATLGARTAHAEVNAAVGEILHVELRLPPPPVVSAPRAHASLPADALLGANVAPPLGPGPLALPVPREGSAPPAFWNARRLAGLSIGAAGVVSTGFALGFQIGAQAAQSDAQSLAPIVAPSGCVGPNRAPVCAALANAHAQQNSDADASRVFFALGAGALVVGAALVLWPSSPEPPRTPLVPIGLPGGAGLQLQGEL
jgi:hypothetical protein